VLAMVFPPSVPSRYRFTACILSFEENLAIKNAPPIVSYVSNNWGALHIWVSFLCNKKLSRKESFEAFTFKSSKLVIYTALYFFSSLIL
ncbi:hypothetical protein P4K24_28970, partial [Bacillus cereus]|nr:hypothetical protein [Bacillus cereus]